MKIGLTGGIGVGKSTVAKVFATIGVPVYHADFEAKKFYKDISIATEVAKRFNLVLDENMQLDLKALAAVAFNSAENIKWLNDLIHPLVIKDFENWYATTDYNYVVMESAIIYEAYLSHLFDRVIVVAAPEELTIKRLIERDKTDVLAINKRKSFQWQQIEKIKKADYIIENNLNEAVLPKIIEIHENILLEVRKTKQ